MAVDALCLGADEYVLLVGRHGVAIDARELDLALGVVHIKEHACLLASLERTYHNSLAIHQLAIALAIVQGIDTIDAMSAKCAIGNRLQCEGTILSYDIARKEWRNHEGQCK